jgi:uncharacterized membrane protein
VTQRVASAAFVVVLCALVWGLMHVAWYTHNQVTDYGVYRKYGNAMVHRHAVPYRDFRPEYPPAAMPVFAAAALFDGWDFRKGFQLLMALCYTALVLCVLAIRGRGAAALAAVAPLALGSVVLSRFDFWPAALAVGALAALLRRHPGLSGVLLGTAIAAKLWPGALAPFFLVWLWRNEGRRATRTWSIAALAAVAAWFVPFVVLGPRGVAHSFYQQFARPLQIESLGASILVAIHHVFGTTLGVTSSFGSQNLIGTGVHAVATATSVVEVLVVLATWIFYVRGDTTDEERLLVACAAVVAALIIFGKVYSPQFAIWLIPFVPLVRSITARVLFVAALVLTQVYFPKRYFNYDKGFYVFESGIVLLRNLTVLALFAVLAFTLARRRPEPVSPT